MLLTTNKAIAMSDIGGLKLWGCLAVQQSNLQILQKNEVHRNNETQHKKESIAQENAGKNN